MARRTGRRSEWAMLQSVRRPPDHCGRQAKAPKNFAILSRAEKPRLEDSDRVAEVTDWKPSGSARRVPRCRCRASVPCSLLFRRAAPSPLVRSRARPRDSISQSFARVLAATSCVARCVHRIPAPRKGLRPWMSPSYINLRGSVTCLRLGPTSPFSGID